MEEMNSHSPSIGQIFCVYLKLAVQPSALPFIPHACSAARPWTWRAHSLSESESHSWNAGPLCDCLPPLIAAEFFFLSPEAWTDFCTNEWNACACAHLWVIDRKGKSSHITPPASHSHPLWFKAVVAKICSELAHHLAFFSCIFAKTQWLRWKKTFLKETRNISV